MKKKAFETLGNDLNLIRLRSGPVDMQLDAQTAAYYNCRCRLAKATIATRTGEGLPLEGYVFPPALHFAKRLRHLRKLISKSHDSYLHVDHNNYVPAIKLKINGGITNNGMDYIPGSKLQFYTGILFIPAIVTWNNWSPMEELWTAEIWEQAGFDYRKLQEPSEIPRQVMETLEFKRLSKNKTAADRSTRQLYKLLVEELKPFDHPDYPGIRSSVFSRAEASDLIKLGSMRPGSKKGGMTFLLEMSQRPFSKIANVTNDGIDVQYQLFLAINMLFRFWERNKRTGREASANIDQLRLGYHIEEKNMSNYYIKAGCRPMTEYFLKRKVNKLERAAKTYFKDHPAEVVKLEKRVKPGAHSKADGRT